MKVLAVIGLSVLALVFLIAPWHFVSTRGWGRRGSWYWHLWVGLAAPIRKKNKPLSRVCEWGAYFFWEFVG